MRPASVVDRLISELPEDIEAERWKSELEGLEQKIRRLEPVNWPQFRNMKSNSQRKVYLDAQLTDLSTALETLEGAIRKIDRETRQRFKDTFDRVNAGDRSSFRARSVEVRPIWN
ncbi:hypothetical protein [Dokdonella sp.]|uniref:hypothetical protein n=1 Tax=Dokdonella sp. TaxID=2291710 RepID=UPI0035288266